jgi:hypothetical protein
MNLRHARWETYALALLLLIGAGFRLYGLNWDDGQWLHPDERQIYFITLGLGMPENLAQALTPTSPLNPGFFAYGSFTFYLLRLAGMLLGLLWPAVRDPDNLHLVGRPLAALLDLGSVYLTYLLAQSLWTDLRAQRHDPDQHDQEDKGVLPATLDKRSGGALARRSGLIAAILMSVATLHVQLAHFYTADSLLVFLILLCLTLTVKVVRGARSRHHAGLALALGLALATKLTALLLVLPLFVGYYMRAGSQGPRSSLSNSDIVTAIRHMLPTLLLAGAVLIACQPYALIDWQTFLGDTFRESQIAWGRLDVPYTRQYAGTVPYLYSTWQTTIWGLGALVGLIGWFAFAAALVYWLRQGPWTGRSVSVDAVLLAWAWPYLLLSGLLYTKYLRYMLPLVPVLCLLAARLGEVYKSSATHSHTPPQQPHHAAGRQSRWPVQHLASLFERVRTPWQSWLLGLAILTLAAYTLAYSSIYAEPHSWIRASAWIYEKVPPGSTLAVEEWDTALPLPLTTANADRRIEEYDVRILPLYDEPDDEAKWTNIAAVLAQTDYVVVASRRVYGSAGRLPDRYPVTSRYYELLFTGELGFHLIQEFTRGPSWLNPRMPPLPDAAPAALRPDESFVVYDHPRALILQNTDHLSTNQLLLRLGIPGATGDAVPLPAATR